MVSNSNLELIDGSRVGVIGAGPAGSLFSYFLLDLAHNLDTKISLDIYESRDYFTPGPVDCNMCAGVISETLVQALSLEGISLPPTVVQRGIDSYIMHSESETMTIKTPLNEMRIATAYRGTGDAPIATTSMSLNLVTLKRGYPWGLASRIYSIAGNAQSVAYQRAHLKR